MDHIIDGFHQALVKELDALQERNTTDVMSIGGESAEKIALQYERGRGYARALRDVRAKARELEDRLYNKRNA